MSTKRDELLAVVMALYADKGSRWSYSQLATLVGRSKGTVGSQIGKKEPVINEIIFRALSDPFRSKTHMQVLMRAFAERRPGVSRALYEQLQQACKG